jgi:hypothetical protein
VCSRTYIRFLESLEADVSRLEEEASKLSKNATVDASRYTQDDDHPARQTRQMSRDMAISPPAPSSTNFDWSSISEANYGAFHPRLAYGMNRMIHSALSVDNSFPFHSHLPNPLLPLIRNSSALRHTHPAMTIYLDTYFQSVHPCLPFLDEDSVRALLDHDNLEGPTHSPLLLMALSIGAILSTPHGPVSKYHAIELFTSAIDSFTSKPPADDFSILQFILLVAIFSLFNPVGGSTWHLVGLAIQILIALGLHQQRGHEALQRNGSLHLGENAFWSAYILDRQVQVLPRHSNFVGCWPNMSAPGSFLSRWNGPLALTIRMSMPKYVTSSYSVLSWSRTVHGKC